MKPEEISADACKKIDVDSEMSDDGQLISTIKLSIVMTD